MAKPIAHPTTVKTNVEGRPSGFQTLEAAGKVLAIGAGFLYVSGLLMVNLYLLRFGASDFAILRTRYALSGMIVLVTFLLFSASGFYAVYSEAAGHESQVLRSLLSTLPASAYTALVLLVPLPDSDPQSLPVVLLRSFPISVSSYLASMWIVHWQAKAIGERGFRPLLGITGLLIFGLLVTMPFATYEVYPRVPAQFGGGRSVRARVAIANESEGQLASLGIRTSPESKLSFPLDIIHDGESFLVLRTNRSIVQIERKAIVGIWVKESRPGVEYGRGAPASQVPKSATYDQARALAARHSDDDKTLSDWEFMELSHWVWDVFESEIDSAKKDALANEISKRIEALPSRSECRRRCEELTAEFYDDYKRKRVLHSSASN
jgi:hypothetical protein